MKYSIQKWLDTTYGGVSYEDAETEEEAARLIEAALKAGYVEVRVSLSASYDEPL